jgi:hypothetical protein
MINLKSEIQIKSIEREEIQLSLVQTRLELDKLKRPINQTKFTNTSYISTQFDDYENRMNKIDEDIIKILIILKIMKFHISIKLLMVKKKIYLKKSNYLKHS